MTQYEPDNRLRDLYFAEIEAAVKDKQRPAEIVLHLQDRFSLSELQAIDVLSRFELKQWAVHSRRAKILALASLASLAALGIFALVNGGIEFNGNVLVGVLPFGLMFGFLTYITAVANSPLRVSKERVGATQLRMVQMAPLLLALTVMILGTAVLSEVVDNDDANRDSASLSTDRQI